MGVLEAYLFLFFDSLMSTLVFVSNTEMVYKAMNIFHGFNKYYMALVASCGAAIGGSVNYLFGRVLHSLKQKVGSYEDSEKFKCLSRCVDRRLFWLVAFAILPIIGVVITTVSGFFRIRYYKFVLIMLLSRIFYYIILYDLF